jgi:hypothetical protein
MIRRHAVMRLRIFVDRASDRAQLVAAPRTEHIYRVVKYIHRVSPIFSSCRALTHATVVVWIHICRVSSNDLVLVVSSDCPVNFVM